ncbi:MAG: prepilin-type N-terminal cleavage/methylation domain-containing protein [Candidatus Riflebacteria bacterium]|nr:prepilin-type N-terminal cleavage/methylation domain-containing protein [Candidatus Riflebacteria bacterium]
MAFMRNLSAPVRKTRCRAFTLIELLIAVSILAIFLYFAYNLFIGGQKVSMKAQWIGMVVDQLRNGTQILNIQLKSTSYPTTLLPDAIKDPSCADAPAGAAEPYYVKVKAVSDKVAAKDMSAAGQSIMSWVCCDPERPPGSGTIVINDLIYTPTDYQLVKVGKLRLRSRGFTFKSVPKDYAQSGKIMKTPNVVADRDIPLIEDVEWVRFTMPQCPTPDPQPIKIEIHCVFPKDPNVFKENSLMITPNVGVGTL